MWTSLPPPPSGRTASHHAPGLSYVIGTTGIPAGSWPICAHLHEHGSSAVVTPNFSVGVNVFFKTCDILAHYLRT